MIFVTVGTQDKPFDRLLRYLDEADIKDEVIIQSGFTKYSGNRYEAHDYLDKDLFDRYLKEADVIITHGGVGTIMKALFNKKKVIACARLSKYGEHQNDHQIQIIKALKDQGYILELNENNKLNDLLEEMKAFKVPELKSNRDNFIRRLSDYIDSL